MKRVVIQDRFRVKVWPKPTSVWNRPIRVPEEAIEEMTPFISAFCAAIVAMSTVGLVLVALAMAATVSR